MNWQEYLKGKKILLTILALVLLILGGAFTGRYFSTRDDVVGQGEDFSNPAKNLIFESATKEGEKVVYLYDFESNESTPIIRHPYSYVGLFGENLVVTNENTGEYYRYNFDTNNLKKLNFPTLSKTEKTYEKLRITNDLTGQGNQLLIIVYEYHLEDPIMEYFGDRTARGQKKYVYSFEADFFSQPADLMEAENKLDSASIYSNGYFLRGLDQTGKFAYFQFGHLAGVGDLVKIDLAANEIVQTLWKDISKARPSDFYINTPLNLGMYIDRKGRNIKAVAVSLENIEIPLYEVDLTGMMKKYYPVNGAEPRITTVEWLDEDHKALLGFDNGIILANLQSGVADFVYEDNTRGRIFNWGFNQIDSTGGNFFAILDAYSTEYETCPSGIRGCISKDKNNDRYRILIKNIADGSEMYILDGLDYKNIIGWVSR